MDDNEKIEILREGYNRVMENRRIQYELLKKISKGHDVGPGTKYYEEYKQITFREWLVELLDNKDMELNNKKFFDSFS